MRQLEILQNEIEHHQQIISARRGQRNQTGDGNVNGMMQTEAEKTWHEGRTEVAPAVREIAQVLQAGYPDELVLLTGLTLRTIEGGLAVADLVLLTPSASLVGVNVARAGATLAPREVGRELVRRQQKAGLKPTIQVYACWLGAVSPSATDDPSPLLSNATQVSEFMQRAISQNSPGASHSVERLTAQLVIADRAGARVGSPTPPVQRALRRLPRALGLRGGVRPADVSKRLRAALLDRKNHLEDARYGKVAPNVYTVVVNEEQYHRHFEPISADLCEQWRRQLLQDLNTANSRQGRKQYRFGGAVIVKLSADPAVASDEVRIDSRVQSDAQSVPEPQPGPEPSSAPVPRIPARPTTDATVAPGPGRPALVTVDGAVFVLHEGANTVGRSRHCDIVVSGKDVLERRLVSGVHARVICTRGECRIFDGTPDGKPSLNGTFVAGRLVPKDGRVLQDGDSIILAALDPRNPRPDTPGVATLIYRR